MKGAGGRSAGGSPVRSMAGASRLRAAGLAAALLVAAAAPPAFAAAPGATGPTLGPLAAAAIALLYYLSYSPWLGGLDYYWLYRPLVGGFLVGLLLGQPVEGTIVGATINLAYLGFISAEGTLPGDPSLAGYLGTAIALTGHLAPAAALAVAVPVGLLGTFVWNLMMTANSAFVHRADAAAARGDIAGLERAALFYPQAFLLLITAVPLFFAVWLGAGEVARLLALVPAWVMAGLGAAGGMIAALGIGINMRAIVRGPAIGFFLAGFVLTEMLHWGLVPLAILAGAAAWAYVAPRGSAGDAEAAGEAAVQDRARGPLRLTAGDVRRAWLRWFLFAQCSYSWERMQGTGFAMAMVPVIRRLYPSAGARARALERHLQFFNTEQTWGAVIPGAAAALEEAGAGGAGGDAAAEAVTAVKSGLMGPFAGIGDTLDQGTVTPILLAFGIGLAKAGSLAGPILFMLLEGAWVVGVDYLSFMFGFHQGRSAIARVIASGRLEDLTRGAGLLGSAVLGGLAATYVRLTTPVTLAVGTARIALQADLLDKLLPGLLPLVLVLAVWAGLRRGLPPLALLLGLFAFGLLGALTGLWA